MSNFIGDNINAIRIDLGLSQEKFADLIGVAQTTVSAWEVGDSTPRKSAVLAITEAIPSITFDDVMSKENGYARKVLRNVQVDTEDSGYIEIPVVSDIAAGTPIELLECDFTFPCPKVIATAHPNSRWYRVVGNSWNRKIPAGCLALVDFDLREPFNDRTPFAVCVNGYKATIKGVQKLENGYKLLPNSWDETILPITFDYNVDGTDEVTIMGEVVYATFPFDYEV